MCKIISAKEIGEIVQNLLDHPEKAGQDMTPEAYSRFMTEIAEVICKHCGGEIRHPADPLEDGWYIGIHREENTPPDGGIWAKYDEEGEF